MRVLFEQGLYGADVTASNGIVQFRHFRHGFLTRIGRTSLFFHLYTWRNETRKALRMTPRSADDSLRSFYAVRFIAVTSLETRKKPPSLGWFPKFDIGEVRDLLCVKQCTVLPVPSMKGGDDPPQNRLAAEESHVQGFTVAREKLFSR
jgi:hypothetical protein